MNQQLKKMISVGMLVACSSLFAPVSQATEITGAGSSFIYPVLSKWAEAYKAKTGNNLNY